MSKSRMGRIAVIPGCAHCPHKAIDSTMGMIQQEDGSWEHNSSEICFCGYWLGTKETFCDKSRHKIRIEAFLPAINGDYSDIINHPDFGKTMPDDCPLPYGGEE